ncbi:MAG TPA: MFS transporter [Pseudolabrys sp.]|uniref:MFS transporter n=1 Tax=Pseudolabrys sp. TaxID=1960880 RepID=UPI002DDD9D87|nr:MFS transporter [Pseudolabrys sp.]HEV2629022.1 MFS transporter [Pseudolabrys sp.]
MTAAPAAIRTLIPARLDRLPWTRFHTLIVIGLGVTWVLDGLEVTMMGAVSGVLQEPATLHFTSADIGLIASFYLTGAVLGSLLFGWLTDRFGRRLFFFVTLATYLVGVLLSAFSWDFWSFAVFRFITGAGIGGEYAAINSAIDELIPARVRGRVDIMINGTYWVGAALGSGATVLLLDPALLPVDLGWRLGFGIGAVLGLGILLVRSFVPESPRWLVTHGYEAEAEKTVAGIERLVSAEAHRRLAPVDEDDAVTVHPHHTFGFGLIVRTVFGRYWRRALVGFSLMVAQAFLYNAIFFTYALVLTRFFHVEPSVTGLYLLPFAFGNVLGVYLLGSLFDTIGRRQMIAATYALSAVLLAITGWLFAIDALTVMTLTALWTAVFFIASPAASSAYLTVSEIFPLETRALAIAFFYSLGTGAGGIAAPWLFGTLIGTGSRVNLFYGYVAAAVLMLAAAAIEMVFGVAAERQSLEKVAEPLSAH